MIININYLAPDGPIQDFEDVIFYRLGDTKFLDSGYSFFDNTRDLAFLSINESDKEFIKEKAKEYGISQISFSERK
jgi:hypothetical protein